MAVLEKPVTTKDNFENEEFDKLLELEESEKEISLPSKSETSIFNWKSGIGYSISLLLIFITLLSYPYDYHFRSIQYVWWCGWVTAIATGLGAIPFCWINNIDRFWLGICNALAAGMMLAATCCLFYEGFNIKQQDNYEINIPSRLMIGCLIGILFIYATKKVLDQYEDVKFGELNGLDARKAVLIMAVMTLHSFSEGIGVGVSFGGEGGERRGILVSATLAIHNIPEGLAISLVLIPRGLNVMLAALWSIFSSMPQPLVAVPAFLFVEKFLPILSVGLGFAGGAMGYVAIMELLPESLEDTESKKITFLATFLSFMAMLTIQFVLTGQI